MLSSSCPPVKAGSPIARTATVAGDAVLSAHLRGATTHTWTVRDMVRRPPALELGLPMRTFPAYPHKRSRETAWFFGPTRSLVKCESGLEATAAMWLEFCGATGVSAQPCRVDWPDGHQHYVDLFARQHDGSGLLVDVRPLERADDPLFARTAHLCEQVGWGYLLFAGLDPQLLHLLDALADYRHDTHRPVDADPLIDACGEPPYGPAIRWAARRYRVSVGQVKIWVAHLMWRRRLVINPTMTFSEHLS